MRAQQLAEVLSAQLLGDPDREISAGASLAAAGPADLVFVEDAKYLAHASQCRAGAVLAGQFAAAGVAGLQSTLLIVEAPRLAFAKALALLSAADRVSTGIHPTAVVGAGADIGPDVSIGAHTFIGRNVRIGARSRIGPGCVLFDGVTLGEACHLVARVTMYAKTTLGARVLVHAGAVLGSDGFGFVRDPQTGAYLKFPQIGRLDVGDDVEIGANATIDRGALDATVIEAGTKIDNLVQIAHNVHIGRNVAISAQVGIAGSSSVANDVVIAGQVGIADHAQVGEGVILGAQSGVPSRKVIRGKGAVFGGSPARPLRDWLRELAALARLAKKGPGSRSSG